MNDLSLDPDLTSTDRGGRVDRAPSSVPPRQGPSSELRVTEARFHATEAAPTPDTTAHSKLTPLPADGLPAPPVAAAPPPVRKPRAAVPLPRLREAIRSAHDVAQARDDEGPTSTSPLVWIAVATFVGFLCAVPPVVWFATREHAPEAPAAQVPVDQDLMGIPVRHDLKLPDE